MVDVIIPAYNANDTLEISLESIAKQTIVNDIKVYIIDDCSKESYDEIVERYSDILNITLMRLEKNSGPGYARQYGIDHSNSKYIMFLDSDDYFTDDDAVEKMYNTMESYDLDAVSSLMNEDYYGEIVSYYVGFDTLHAKIYKRSFLKEHDIRFPSYYNSEDVAFNNLVIINTDKIGQIDANTYTYRRRKDSLTQTDDYDTDKHIRCLVENLEYVLNNVEKNKVDKKYISAFLRTNFSYFMWYFNGDANDPAVHYLNNLVKSFKEYNQYYVEDTGTYWLNYWTIEIKDSFSEKQFLKFINDIK